MSETNKQIIKGTNIDIIYLNIRGQIIQIHENSTLFSLSTRLQTELSTKKERKTLNIPIFLDIIPYCFHSILTYFKQEKDTKKYNHETNIKILSLYKKKFVNNPEILSTFVYLEMPIEFINSFIDKSSTIN